MPVKRGGSQSSADVIKLVSPAAFDKLNAMFTNKVTLAGGNNAKRKMLQDVDLNDGSGAKMLVYNKAGGAKGAKKKAIPKKAAAKKAPAKGKALKGGDGSDIAASSTPSSCLIQSPANFIKVPGPPLPPPYVATPPHGTDSCTAQASQNMLASADVHTMSPIIKNTAFPTDPAYSGSFTFGGGKKKKPVGLKKKKMEKKKPTKK